MRKRRGLPFWPTLMAATAVPVLIGFGVWQLQRAEWKDGVLADLARNSAMPTVVLGADADLADYRFRKVVLTTLACPEIPADIRGGRNLQGQAGYRYILRCSWPDADSPLLVDAGWAPRPDVGAPIRAFRPTPTDGVPPGTLVPMGRGDVPFLLVLAEAQPPLVPSAPPGPDSISDNHISYAIQWFGFAAILALIYGLYVRRWHLAAADGPA